MRFGSGECMHRGVGCGACVLHCYKLAPGFLLLLASTRVRCALRSRTSGSARFPRQSSVPALRSGVLDIGLRSRLSGPTIPTPPPGALGALGVLSSNARALLERARSLSRRALSPALSPLSRSSVSRRASLSACGGFLSRGSRPPPMPAAAPRPSGTSSGGWRSSAWPCSP